MRRVLRTGLVGVSWDSGGMDFCRRRLRAIRRDLHSSGVLPWAMGQPERAKCMAYSPVMWPTPLQPVCVCVCVCVTCQYSGILHSDQCLMRPFKHTHACTCIHTNACTHVHAQPLLQCTCNEQGQPTRSGAVVALAGLHKSVGYPLPPSLTILLLLLPLLHTASR